MSPSATISRMIRGVHHVNFLVRDLEAAVERHERLLGVRFEHLDELPDRGVRIARFRAGDTWIALVQPVADGEPMRHLERHGEGFFLLSFEVDDVEAAADAVRRAGGRTTSESPRRGLDGWRVIDLHPQDMGGVIVQLCEDQSRGANR